MTHKNSLPKPQTGNIGIHNITYVLHKRFGKNCTYIITILQEHTQTGILESLSNILPAMFPRAHTACSLTDISSEFSSWIKCGTAPAFTTAFVWSLVPEAMLVSAHAASNWCSVLKDHSRSIFLILLHPVHEKFLIKKRRNKKHKQQIHE